jgi:hypothetical protein
MGLKFSRYWMKIKEVEAFALLQQIPGDMLGGGEVL